VFHCPRFSGQFLQLRQEFVQPQLVVAEAFLTEISCRPRAPAAAGIGLGEVVGLEGVHEGTFPARWLEDIRVFFRAASSQSPVPSHTIVD
jgi:hypothetical protein